ncbi:hypothetical protein HDU83_004201 [Entophlyctis luteolus]|nr:hypothetical protein HDU82_005455 [Entophlyctis luteolus]KAJ3355030.1 hypothetical protein HDU83_004201 [Entophlyctis luteolus]KAJ3380494.1 hypothetical protein HDU84_005777 [Entophlyctis sp. JEL0112]
MNHPLFVTSSHATIAASEALLLSIRPSDLQAARAYVTVICVIDLSTSMNDEVSVSEAEGVVQESDGLTILDLVKHSVNTIVSSLSPSDRLAIVTFSDEAKVWLDLTTMDDKGRQLAKVRVDTMKAQGSTNIWGGLEAGLNVVQNHANNISGAVSTVFLFTDGQPNIRPSKGEIAALKDFQHEKCNGKLPCTINTFGFGYSLDSDLLNSLAVLGRGSYNFIPDAQFVGTVFVDATCNILASAAKDVSLVIQPLNGAEVSLFKDKILIPAKDVDSKQSLKQKPDPSAPLNVVFILDVTGSMGNEIAGVKEMINKFCSVERPNIRIHIWTYTEGGSGQGCYVCTSPPNLNSKQLCDYVSRVKLCEPIDFPGVKDANGGDGPENVTACIANLTRAFGNRDSVLCFVITDADPHYRGYGQSITAKAELSWLAENGFQRDIFAVLNNVVAELNVAFVPILYSAPQPYFYQQAALLSGGLCLSPKSRESSVLSQGLVHILNTMQQIATTRVVTSELAAATAANLRGFEVMPVSRERFKILESDPANLAAVYLSKTMTAVTADAVFSLLMTTVQILGEDVADDLTFGRFVASTGEDGSVTVPLGCIQAQNRKDVLLVMKNLPADPMMAYAHVTLKYSTLGNNAVVNAMPVIVSCQNGGDDSTLRVFTEYTRCLSIMRMMDAYSAAIEGKFSEAFDLVEKLEKNVKRAILKITEVEDRKRLSELLVDIQGQVKEAVREKFFKRWGQHYLLSLIGAHKLQICNNFKDPGVQVYQSPLFEGLRDEINEIFLKIPPPKPSAKPKENYKEVNMSRYMDASGGCFSGNCMMTLADGVTMVPVKCVKKGTKVVTVNSRHIAEISCLVKTQLIPTSKTPLILLPSSGLVITPYHPVKTNFGVWKFPCDLPEAQEYKNETGEVDAVYTAVLGPVECLDGESCDSCCKTLTKPGIHYGPSVFVNGVECAALGHEMTGDTVGHEYFANRERVLSDISKGCGFNEGVVECLGMLRIGDGAKHTISGMVVV